MAALELVHLIQIAAHGAGFLKGTHKGQHHTQIVAAVNAARQLEGLYFPVMDIPRNATITQHGIGFLMLEKIAAQKVAVFVALEVRGAVGNGFAVEGHGKKGQILGQGLDIVLLAGAETARLDKAADFFRQVAHIVHFLFKPGTQANLLAQMEDVFQQLDHSGQILNPLHMRFHAGFDFSSALG